MIVLGLFLVSWACTFAAYFFFPFSHFKLIQAGLDSWILYVALYPLVLGLGFVSVYLWSSRTRPEWSQQEWRPGTLTVDLRRLKRYARSLLTIGGVFTVAKIAIVVSELGLPTSLSYLFEVRIAYLFGGLRIPPLVEFLGRYPLVGLSVLAGVIHWGEGKARYAVYVLLLLTLNNLAIGGRGDIAFGLVLYLTTLLLCLDVSGRPVLRSLLDARIVLMGAAAVGLFVLAFIYLGRLEHAREGFETLVVYFAGNIPTTAYVAEQVYRGEPILYFASNVAPTAFLAEGVYRGDAAYGLPVMTLHGILRFFQIGLDLIGIQMPLPLADFGFMPAFADGANAPVYVEADYGMNTFIYAAYLLADWGLAGGLLMSFLLGASAAFTIVQAKARLTPLWIVAAIMMATLLLTSHRGLASKLISWWMAGVVSLHALAMCSETREA